MRLHGVPFGLEDFALEGKDGLQKPLLLLFREVLETAAILEIPPPLIEPLHLTDEAEWGLLGNHRQLQQEIVALLELLLYCQTDAAGADIGNVAGQQLLTLAMEEKSPCSEVTVPLRSACWRKKSRWSLLWRNCRFSMCQKSSQLRQTVPFREKACAFFWKPRIFTACLYMA